MNHRIAPRESPSCPFSTRWHARPLVLALAAAMASGAFAHETAAPAADTPLVLRPSARLQEDIAAKVREQLPTFVSGEFFTGRADLESVIDGQAMLRRGDLVVRAERMEYDQASDLAKARGDVRINRAGNLYEGSQLELKLDAFQGYFLNPRYRFLLNNGHGEGQRIDFLDDKRSTIRDATYTTCKRQPGPDWLPDWVLRASTIHFDTEDDVGQADGAVLQFQGVPILPFPALSFPLSDKRKSGWLPALIETDSVSGLVLTTPYYWNLAPQRDVTFSPSVLSRRGVNMGVEFRYLEPGVSGVVRTDLMPTDTLRDRARWGLTTQHSGTLDTGAGGIGFNINLNRVSDDNYWRDFPRATDPLRQRLLPNDATFSWASGDLSSSLRTLKWQTLQDVSAPIVPPFDRMPELNVRYGKSNVGGFDYSIDTNLTQFEADRSLTQQVNGLRSMAIFQISHPWQSPGWFVTPKVQWHATQYHLDEPLSDGSRSASRTLPTFSLDSGLVLERDTRFFGRDLRQTLEPRALYVLTPYRDQSKLPNYDSASQDFNFASIYSENTFLGNDRISDSNLLTLGVTSRLLDPVTGAEAARLGVAQRLRFKDQNVTLPGGTPVKDRISDIMVGAAINWSPQWSSDTTIQFNPKTSRSETATLGSYYNPSPYHVVSAAYRLQRGVSEQLDLGWQWPLNFSTPDGSIAGAGGQGLGAGRWYTVGRMNYSLQDRKLVDSVFGFEYDAGCWLGRVVLDRSQSSAITATTRLAFQLEFVGFAKPSLGADPLKILKDNVPRYQYLREPLGQPSRFGQYD